MNLRRGVVYLLLRILSVNTEDIVSEEKHGDSARGNDHIPHHSKGSERRLMEELDDRDWHVSHLKEADFSLDTDCKEETFSDKVIKYRKTLKEDGSLVDYVVADALPVNDDDLVKTKVKDKCIADNKTDKERKILKKQKQIQLNVTKDTEVTTMQEVKTATVADIKDTVKQWAKVKNGTDDKSRRASEYQFSSAEYYDEVDEFQDRICPEFVEVVHLEIDILRNYDVECELTVEWRSLE